MIQNKLSTKQFAKLCKVEKRTLYYYDEIDLLKPVEIKENGYRIYSSEQFDAMSMIKALQSVGMSLYEIKNLMNEHDLSHYKSVLNNQINLIREKQQELKIAEEILIQTMDQLDHYLENGCSHIFTEKSTDIYLITQEIQKENSIFVNYITSGYNLGVIMNEKAATVPQYVFKKAMGRTECNAVKPAGTYACIYQSVPNGRIPEEINSFITSLSSQHMITEGPLYLDSIGNDFVRFPNQEFIFKLSIKLNKM